jgi:homoaconitase/3-isopropylmalate dehydratase large subunit
MEGRMTVCNMSIEMGARGGMIAPDQTTFDYVSGREFAPKGKALKAKITHWKTLPTDEGASFDAEYNFDAADIGPMITYGRVALTSSTGVKDDDVRETRSEKNLEQDDLLAASCFDTFPCKGILLQVLFTASLPHIIILYTS